MVVMPRVYSDVMSSVKAALSKGSHVSFTADFWMGEIDNRAYVSLTGHWIMEDFDRKTALLHVQHFAESNLSENVAVALEQMLKNWKLKDKFHCAVLYGSMYDVNAMQRQKLPFITCMADTLQLVVEKALKSQVVSNVLSLARSLAGHFCHSTEASDVLRKHQHQLPMPMKAIIEDNPAWWNSTFYMLERLLELREPISRYLREHPDVAQPASGDWNLMEKIMHLLAPFEEMMREFSKRDACVSLIIPFIQLLLQFLRGMPDDEVGTIKRALIDSLNSQLSAAENNIILSTATLLDPRFKTCFFIQASTQEEVKAALERDECVEESPMQTASGPPTEKAHKEQTSIWDHVEDFTHGQTGVQIMETIATEVHGYVRGPLLDRSQDPLLWWRQNTLQYPRLAQAARRYLSAPPASVAGQQAFSELGSALCDRRAKLPPECAERWVFLNGNLY